MLRLAVVGGWQSCSAKKTWLLIRLIPKSDLFLKSELEGLNDFLRKDYFQAYVRLFQAIENFLCLWKVATVQEVEELQSSYLIGSRAVVIAKRSSTCLWSKNLWVRIRLDVWLSSSSSFSSRFLSHLQQNQLSFLNQVPQEGASLLMMRWTQKIVLAVLLGAKQAKYMHRMEFKKASHREPLKYWTEREGQIIDTITNDPQTSNITQS